MSGMNFEARIKRVYASFPLWLKKIIRPVLRNFWYLRYLIRLPYYLVLLSGSKNKPLDIKRFEWKVYSEQGEDGVLWAIFKKIGVTNKFLVDFGAGDGVTCNSGLLIKHLGWKGLQMDLIEDGVPRVKIERVTAENIEDLFNKYEVPKEFDLLSIDTDFNDYWIWKAITNYSPRVVVLEYNPCFEHEESLAVRYDPDGFGDGSDTFGATLRAYENLARQKGYTLVGGTSKGMNCFFVRNDCLKEYFVTQPVSSVYVPRGYHRKSTSGVEMVEV